MTNEGKERHRAGVIKGGMSKSEAKINASRNNGKKGGRPKKIKEIKSED